MGSLQDGGLYEGISNKRQFDNGYCTSFGAMFKYKMRKVSVLRDFPPGCGRNALNINPKAQDAEAVALLGDKENSVGDEKKVNIAECAFVKTFEIGNELFSHQLVKSSVKSELVDSFDGLVEKPVAVDEKVQGVYLFPVVESLQSGLPIALENDAPEFSVLHEVEVKAVVKTEGAPESKTALEIGSLVGGMIPAADSKVDGMIPAAGAKAWSLPQWPMSDTNIPKQTSLENKYPRRRVSATRDFPPFCGRNAPWPTEEERLAIILGNRTMNAPARGTVRAKEDGSPLRETARIGVEWDGREKKMEGKGSGTEPKIKFPKAVVQGGPLIKTVRTDVGGCFMRERVRAFAALHEDVRGGNALKRKLEGSVPEPNTKSQKVINCSTKSGPAGDVALGHEADTVIVQGMAAADHPWRHGKGGGIVGTSLGGMISGTEVRRHYVRRITGQNSSTSVNRENGYEADHLGGKSMKKKFLPSGKASSESKHVRVVKDERVFSIQHEHSSAGQRPCNFKVVLPPFGPSSLSQSNTRNKVRETLRLFQAICRKLLQGEEAIMRPHGFLRRIDLLAAKIIKEKGKEVNTSKQIIGSVPGVEVGDEFQYRVELALVGVHRPYQSGIDYVKHGGTIIATSIVASGSYADDLDNPDVLMYSGQGGNIVRRDKQPEDQKLQKGNLALKNSISAKNPVRVIHGSKETKASTSDARAKIVLTYDGLYTVDRWWNDVGPQGQLVFMFELKRIPGQPEVAWKEIKKSNKFKARDGLCTSDISGGKELFPICAVNTKDKEKPPKFNYISKMKYPDWYCPTPHKGCDCIGRCSAQKCLCVVKNGGEFPYNHNGTIVEVKPLVYECGPSCKCPPSCYNRVSQHGIKIQLEIFKTRMRGWGVRSLTSIPSGSFICEYTGELLEDKEAEQRHNDEYLFDIGKNYSDCSLTGLSTLQTDAQLSSRGVEDGCFTIDAAKFGNIGRLINHSCSPNLYAQNVLYDHEDKRMPHIMLFAAENIAPLKELTYHYNYSVDQIQDSNGNIKRKSCYCGSAGCTGRLY